MATIEVTKNTLSLVRLPEEDSDPSWLKFVKKVLGKTPKGDGEKTFQLNAFLSVGTKRDKTPWSLEWLLRKGFRPRDYWVLLLEVHRGDVRVIASRDEAAIKDAQRKVRTAIDSQDPRYLATVTIENSTIVMDTEVHGNVENSVNKKNEPKSSAT